MITRVRARIVGRVQGVGFRPTVYRFATELGLCGFVCNDPGGVVLEVEGEELQVGAFFTRLTHQPPKQSVIDGLEPQTLAVRGYERFEIVDSEPVGDARVYISPDLATCDECLGELLDPADRRHEYPFINCTNCGPRFSIIQALPYDRARTTMAGFAMCPACNREYRDPLDRRFHAQPDACDSCGPRLRLQLRDGVNYSERALSRTVSQLQRGRIVAIKGLGGYHLACDATQPEAVAELRLRKHRPHKPLAVMFRDLAAVKQCCEVSEAEEAELLSAARPIVILRRKLGCLEGWKDAGTESSTHPAIQSSTLPPFQSSNRPIIPSSLSPDSPTLGAFLPYTPLHHLLLRPFLALVMTSGNLRDEPIISTEDELDRIFGPIADAALIHNRPIAHRVDDSVLRVLGGHRQFLRRARGYIPNPIRLANRSPQVLSVGGELKNTFCLVRDGLAFLSQHVGDLGDYPTHDYFLREIESWKNLMRVQPETVACDLHPGYRSTKWAGQWMNGKMEEWKNANPQSSTIPPFQCIAVQHHHAHIASVLAEHGLEQPVIGVALDGTGYGPDGTIWGGEFLVADRRDYERVAHFRRYRLPGGDQAVAEPWRMAVSVLWSEGLVEEAGAFAARHGGGDSHVITGMIETGFHSPLSSSAGRLFDAVSALLGLCPIATYEAQAAIRLESAVDPAVDDRYPFQIDSRESMHSLNFGPAIRALRQDQAGGVSIGVLAARFHNTLVEALARTCELVRERHQIDTVALSGGVFQNAVLLSRTVAALQARGFEVYTNAIVPPNDGGLALGQAAVAVARMEKWMDGSVDGWKTEMAGGRKVEASRSSNLPLFPSSNPAIIPSSILPFIHSSAEEKPCV